MTYDIMTLFVIPRNVGVIGLFLAQKCKTLLVKFSFINRFDITLQIKIFIMRIPGNFEVATLRHYFSWIFSLQF